MEKNPADKPRFSLIYVLLALWLILSVIDFVSLKRNVESIPYSQFLFYIEKHAIEELVIGPENISGTLKEKDPDGKIKEFLTIRVDDPKLSQRLTDAEIRFSGQSESKLLKTFLTFILPLVVFVAIFWFMAGRMGQTARAGGFLPLGKSRAKIYVEKDLKIRFDDVAGVDEAKEELREIVNFLRDPNRYSKLGGRMPKGVMLVGPPGTGKTLLARAVAGEANVPFFSINGSEFVELFVGLGAARVRDLFNQARIYAPCIIFIDELDALGKARGISAISGSGNDEKEQTLNQLLAEMDGFDPSIGVVLLAATNRPEVLDPALLRAGRFDRHVVLDRPDRIGRKKILEIHLKKIKTSSDINAEIISSMTAGFSGADLANLVNEAALIATRRMAESVELRDCTEAVERIIAGLERKNRLLSYNEKMRVAYHEMGHAVAALTLGQSETVHKVSIIPRGISAIGYTLHRPTEDRYLMEKQELENKLSIMLAGRASEITFFDDISTGAADDLDKATEIARAMITRYGMAERLGLAVFEREPAPLLGGQAKIRSFDYSEHTAQLIDTEIERLLEKALETATTIVDKFKAVIEEGVRILLEKETIDEAELRRIWEKQEKITRIA
ncbi:MAG: ATP-dependent zinc metalloprotease FtsH [Candidatus Poribacteria bacterium]